MSNRNNSNPNNLRTNLNSIEKGVTDLFKKIDSPNDSMFTRQTNVDIRLNGYVDRADLYRNNLNLNEPSDKLKAANELLKEQSKGMKGVDNRRELYPQSEINNEYKDLYILNYNFIIQFIFNNNDECNIYIDKILINNHNVCKFESINEPWKYIIPLSITHLIYYTNGTYNISYFINDFSVLNKNINQFDFSSKISAIHFIIGISLIPYSAPILPLCEISFGFLFIQLILFNFSSISI